MPLPQTTALVTGASRGIGRAIAESLAARGVTIAVHYHQNEAAARSVLEGLPGAGHHLFRANLEHPEDAARLADEVKAHYPRLDLLINNAGIYEEHDVRGEDAAAFTATLTRTLAANLLGPAILSYHAVQHLLGNPPSPTGERGRIINITSRAAFRGELTAPGYAASKAGLNIFGQSLAQTLAPEGIYVYTVAPGWVETDMASSLKGPSGPAILAQHPLGRVAHPDEVARTVLWLALDAPPALTGSIIDANGASYLRT